MNFFERLYMEILSNFDVWMTAQLSNNDFLVATIFAGLSGIALYLLRNVPQRIYYAIKNRLTIRVVINNDNQYFVPITAELNKNSINMFTRSLILDRGKITIGFANSISFFQGKIVHVNRVEKDSDSREFKQSVTLTFFSLRKMNIENLFEEFISSERKGNFENVQVFTSKGGSNSLSYLKKIPIRKRESIFVPSETIDYIEKRIDFFQNNKSWYEEKGIPYKYAIILYGPPGTGKTTLAKYIAGYAKRNVVYMNLAGLKNISQSITYYANDYYYDDPDGDKKKEDKFLGLLEDIDSDKVVHNRETEDGEENNEISLNLAEPISFTEVLNSIDGLNAPEDFILVATTNHIDRIDPALKRKGRFDDMIEIGLLRDRDIKKMIDFYFPKVFDWDKISVTFEPIEGAKLQDAILTNLDDSQKLIQFLTKEEK